VVSDFPQCYDMRGHVWRLLTYQLVHAGYQHIIYNIAMQLTFGLPLNMVQILLTLFPFK
jgi:membrane associated rhomboid family serine protease